METFPLTLAAIKNAEKSQWAIGDALLAECGPPSEQGIRDGSYKHIEEATKYLLAEGYEYEVKSLLLIRTVADSFKSPQRRFNVSWSVYKAAQTPEFLNAVIAGAPKGVRITQRYVDGIRKQQVGEERMERESAAEKAREEREQAEQAEVEARTRVREAKEEREKQATEAKLAKAEAKTRKAKEKEKETKTAPKKKPRTPVKDDVPLLAVKAQFIADAAHSVKLAKLSAKRIKESLDQLNGKGIAMLIEAALEAANAWTDAARIVRSEIVDQSGHLSVVGD